MEINDIKFIKTEDGYKARCTKYEPNKSDAEVRQLFDGLTTHYKNKLCFTKSLSKSEFLRYREGITSSLEEMIGGFVAMAEELMALRETTAKIQEERDELLDAYMLANGFALDEEEKDHG